MKALVVDYAWSPRDQWGHASSDLDPFVALQASQAPPNVIAAFELARGAGFKVLFMSHSCHLGGSEFVAAEAVTDLAVRAAFDELDRVQEPDHGPMMCERRWFKTGGGVERWEWITEDY